MCCHVPVSLHLNVHKDSASSALVAEAGRDTECDYCEDDS